MSFIRKTNRGSSLVDMAFLVIIIPLLTFTFTDVTIKALKEFKQAQLYSTVVKGNSTFLKALGGIRFGNEVKWLDASTDRGTVRIGISDDKEIRFVGDNGSATNDDVSFFNEKGDEIYVYDKDLLRFAKFVPTELNDGLNRTALRFHVKFGTSGSDSQLTAVRFGKDASYFVEYDVTYTLRNRK